MAAARPHWVSWDEVPWDPLVVRSYGPWFLEVFSGTARLSTYVASLGIPVLPPVDIELSEMVPQAVDVLDLEIWDRITQLAHVGAIFFVHLGTPCNSFSSARKLDGRPPPLRSPQCPMGLPDLSEANQGILFLGNMFACRSVELAMAVFSTGGDFSIENPLLSLLWATPLLVELARLARCFDVDFDQCVYGAPSVKPTRLRVTAQIFEVLSVSCPGNHAHVQLRGQIWDAKKERFVFRTKLAQEYPYALCASMALLVHQLWLGELPQFDASFNLAPVDRKRPLGQLARWKGHRQEDSARQALVSGYQLKRGALKPLLDIEMEPGQAARWALTVVHPFTVQLDVEASLQTAVHALALQPAAVIARRLEALQWWEAEAHRLLPETIARIEAQSDPDLRTLLRGCSESQTPKLGQVCHVALYEAMLLKVASVDVQLADDLLHGFPIVGAIRASGRWPPYAKPQVVLPVSDALARAWEIRKKIVQRVKAVQVSENLQKIWDATLEDCSEGSCKGPWFSEKEVSEFLGCEDWIPTQRFEVVQKNKVRGCDSATTNMINQITKISEKLQLPSTDSNVAALRLLRSAVPLGQFAGWVLDERKAYRQIAVKPEQRKFSVIALKDPKSARPAFFVMIGHSFGLVSAVYNYNRRSAAINEILVKLFGLVAFSFYDDKYGFELESTAASARLVAECVHTWLGARYDQKKLQLSEAPTILGVTYNLKDMQLEIKADRKEDLSGEIRSILDNNVLDPGTAGKLKGKLMFGASQLWGKVGRAFLRVLSERQYMKFPIGPKFGLDKPLRLALSQWLKLVNEGPPRTIDRQVQKKSDCVIFTDGFTPDPRTPAHERLPDRVGAVLFDRRLSRPIQFTSVVPQSVSKLWLPRSTQIIPIEMLAPILALKTFADRLCGADVIILIDSEVVEAALVKGYSSKEDVCSLISIFWDLALELKCKVFLDRVSTDANPADWPSRNDLARGEAAGWVTVDARWPVLLAPRSGPGSDHGCT